MGALAVRMRRCCWWRFWATARCGSGLVNRIHSTGMPRWAVKWLSWLCLVAVLSIPIVLAALAWTEVSVLEFPAWIDALWRHGVYYFVPCIAIAAAVTILWTRRRLTISVPAALRITQTDEFDVVQTPGFSASSRPLRAALQPRAWNQAFQPRIEYREIEFAPAEGARWRFSGPSLRLSLHRASHASSIFRKLFAERMHCNPT